MSRRTVCLLVLSVLGLVIRSTVSQEVGERRTADTLATSTGTEAQRFPAGVLDDFRLRWYSKHLAAMDERSLNDGTGQDGVNPPREAYRFLWLRTFHHPVAVRLERKKDECLLVAKELDGKGGYAPGKLVLNKSRALTRDEWAELMRRIKACSFWEMSAEEDNSIPDENGLVRYGGIMDGAQWIFEGARDDTYHIADRTCPDGSRNRKLDQYRALCLHVLSLAGFDVHDKNVY